MDEIDLTEVSGRLFDSHATAFKLIKEALDCEPIIVQTEGPEFFL